MKIDQNSLEIVRTFFLQDFLKRDVFRSFDDFFRYHLLVFVLLDHDGMVQGRKQGNRCIQNLSDDDLYVGYYSISCRWYKPWRRVLVRMVNHIVQLQENGPSSV